MMPTADRRSLKYTTTDREKEEQSISVPDRTGQMVKRYLQGTEYDEVRALINQAIVDLRQVWGMEPIEAGKDIVDFFTYETAERPEWLRNNKHKKNED